MYMSDGLDIQMLLTPNTSKFCFIYILVIFFKKKKKDTGCEFECIKNL